MNEYELYHASTRKHKYIKKIGNRYFYTQQEIQAYLEGKKPKSDLTFEKEDYGDGTKDYRLDFNKEKGSFTDSNGKKHTYTMSDKVGVRVDKKNKNVELYNTTNKKFYKNDEKLIRKSKGRVTTEYAEDGVSRKIDLSKDKHNKKAEDERWKRFQEHGGPNVDTPAEYRKKQREKASQKVSNYAEKTTESMKKQASRGKKTLDKWYTKATTPDITVTYDEAQIKDNKSSSKTTNTTKKKKPKKQKSKARKAINKFYRNNINPGVTVTYDEAKIK